MAGNRQVLWPGRKIWNPNWGKPFWSKGRFAWNVTEDRLSSSHLGFWAAVDAWDIASKGNIRNPAILGNLSWFCGWLWLASMWLFDPGNNEKICPVVIDSLLNQQGKMCIYIRSKWKYHPRLSMTLQKWGNGLKLRGHDPFFFYWSWRH